MIPNRLRSLLAAALAFALILPSAAAEPEHSRVRALSSFDERRLARVLAEECPDVPYAARVGMAAAVLGRMDDPGYPDSLTEVLAGFWREGSFGAERTTSSHAGRSLRDGVRRLLKRLSGAVTGRGDEKRRLLELSLHAVRAAEAGADPMDGALSFRVVRSSRPPDFLFNDSGEDTAESGIREALRGYPVIVGGVGFR